MPSPAISPRQLILGSTSRYRLALLKRLRLPFDVVAPEVDETPLVAEAPQALALRLALAKAKAVSALHPKALVIGSDQVLDFAGQPLGKPANHANAVAMLQALSGHAVVFYTAVAVCCAESGFEALELATVTTKFRDLSDAEIERYLHADQPYDCAGSAKSESLGIALLEYIQSDDPTALEGLPLIRTCNMLRAAGLSTL